jgi:hypothetical protein
MAEKLNNLSQHVVGVMKELSRNDGLVELLSHNILTPLDSTTHTIRPKYDTNNYYVINSEGNFVLPEIDNDKIYNPSSSFCKILPYPFDPDATVSDGSFIRVYYNQGEFNDGQTIQEMSMHVDIIVAKSLWLINDLVRKQSLIRPYEIMDRVVDMVGKRSVSPIKLNFTGWQHLAVNTKFDAIRLYSDYYSVEAENHYGI